MTTSENPLDFDLFDTKVAFRHLSTAKLRYTKFLFALMQNNVLTNLGAHVLQSPFTLHIPFVPTAVKKTLFEQFCGGETIDDALRVLESLAAHKVSGILDFAAERGHSESDFERAFNAVLNTIRAMASFSSERYAVFKPTAIIPFQILHKVSQNETLTPSETEAWNRGKERVSELCKKAAAANTIIMADAEESWLQPALDSLMLDMMRRHNKKRAIVFTTLQFYRTGRVQLLKELIADAESQKYVVGIKAVRGAYMEKERTFAGANGSPSPIHNTKAETDTHFNEGVQLALENMSRVSICVATHNEHSVLKTLHLLKHGNLEKSHPHVSFSQLYGMSSHITYNLATAGYRVSKYIPYGNLRDVIPYLMRRAQENTSVQGQTAREVELLSKELLRRKKI